VVDAKKPLFFEEGTILRKVDRVSRKNIHWWIVAFDRVTNAIVHNFSIVHMCLYGVAFSM
jgi:hypothetical protein